MPPANVEVAVVLVALIAGTLSPVYRVEVATPAAPVRPGVARKFATPWMLKRVPGLVVPIPKFPVLDAMVR